MHLNKDLPRMTESESCNLLRKIVSHDIAIGSLEQWLNAREFPCKDIYSMVNPETSGWQKKTKNLSLDAITLLWHFGYKTELLNLAGMVHFRNKNYFDGDNALFVTDDLIEKEKHKLRSLARKVKKENVN